MNYMKSYYWCFLKFWRQIFHRNSERQSKKIIHSNLLKGTSMWYVRLRNSDFQPHPQCTRNDVTKAIYVRFFTDPPLLRKHSTALSSGYIVFLISERQDVLGDEAVYFMDAS